MALDTNQIETIAEVIRSAPTLLEAAARWHERYPGVRAMRIGAAEMRDETPAIECGGRRVYFATSDGMCVSVTRDAGEADIVILTEDGAAHGDR